MTRPTAEENRQWIRDRLDERGLTAKLIPLALEVVATAAPAALPWAGSYALAYSAGHNDLGLRSRRLGHFASAYADICEEIECRPSPADFYAAWDAGEVFEGTASEHWLVAGVRPRSGE